MAMSTVSCALAMLIRNKNKTAEENSLFMSYNFEQTK
jgi:hypothetical protein